MTILTVTEYPQVRAALGIGLDADALPDNTIGLDIYAGRAETMVEARTGAYAALSAANQKRAMRAVILLTASLLAPSIPRLASLSVDNLSMSYAQRDWDALAAGLLNGTACGTVGESVQLRRKRRLLRAHHGRTRPMSAGAFLTSALPALRAAAEAVMTNTATIKRGATTVATGVKCRVSTLPDNAQVSDLAGTRAALPELYFPVSTDIRIADVVTVGSHEYRVFSARHSVTWRAELAFACELLAAPGEALP